MKREGKLTGQDPSMAAYADHARGGCHRSLLPHVFAIMQEVAGKIHMKFADEEIFLHGTSPERDIAQEALPAQLHQYVRRADLPQSIDDVDVVMGCPIRTCNETVAFDALVAQHVGKVIDDIQELNAMRDAVAEDRVMEYGEQSASFLLFASLAFARRTFDHWLKNISWGKLETHPKTFDSKMDEYTHSSLNLHESHHHEATIHQLH
jgi:hypothetical protein